MQRVDWYIDDALAASTAEPRYPWPLQSGPHRVKAELLTDAGTHTTEDIQFYVR